MPRTAETASFMLNHAMIRIKDPKASLAFYLDTLGMDLLDEVKMDEFTLYFIGYDRDGTAGDLVGVEKVNARRSREGVLELTYIHETETDPNFQGYASGNSDPGKGFGHIAITVEDVEAACARFERLGVPFQKRLTDGKMKNIAFILDPDGYWVEILPCRL